uniref:Membrane protein FAM174B n=1 Tax=Suricata suricatta TaxID=37032 RepID=A0A673THW2_SURSU
LCLFKNTALGYYFSRSLGFSVLKRRHSRLHFAGEDPEGGRGPGSVRVPVAETEGVGTFARASGSRLEGAAALTCGHHGVSGACLSSSRSGKRLKKTRKYDIITTPAERVEMAPLNEEDDEDEDSTVFDIKYR